MEVNIIQAGNNHFDDCKISLQGSEIGRIYFKDENKINRLLTDAISKNRI